MHRPYVDHQTDFDTLYRAYWDRIVHLCAKCLRCSDCCACEVTLEEHEHPVHPPEVVRKPVEAIEEEPVSGEEDKVPEEPLI